MRTFEWRVCMVLVFSLGMSRALTLQYDDADSGIVAEAEATYEKSNNDDNNKNDLNNILSPNTHKQKSHASKRKNAVNEPQDAGGKNGVWYGPTTAGDFVTPGANVDESQIVVPNPNNNNNNTQDDADSNTDTSSASSHHSDDDDKAPVDYVGSNKYLKFRPTGQDFIQQSQNVVKELRQLLTQGVEVVLVTQEKKGAFGRKKASKRIKCAMQLSDNGRQLKWGPSLKALKESIDVDSISNVKYGYQSEVFAKIKDSPTREEEWTCVTIEVFDKHEHNFVIADDNVNLAVMAVLSPPRFNITPARWRWIRSFHKFQVNEVGLIAALNKMARAKDIIHSDDDASSVASSHSSGKQ
eukprot:c12378_g1_i2.p1 GENE.c12378_g1_i2~~c12378_g1_i2.p1  ORF type:complete len:354 (+),score=114.58 c12378_g1_i2:55-1116(+)